MRYVSFYLGAASTLRKELSAELATYRGQTFAANTQKTNATHMRAYFKVCDKLCIDPVPVCDRTIALYATYLARTLKPSSVRQYLNIVRLLHPESGLEHVYKDSWVIKSTLRGIDRTKGCAVHRKAPITPTVLLAMREKS